MKVRFYMIRKSFVVLLWLALILVWTAVIISAVHVIELRLAVKITLQILNCLIFGYLFINVQSPLTYTPVRNFFINS